MQAGSEPEGAGYANLLAFFGRSLKANNLKENL
jgi:hypothetical protein